MQSRIGLSSSITPPPPSGGETFVDLLRQRALEHPARQAYTFLLDGERELCALSFGELDLQARAVAASLTSVGASDERVLLLYNPGLDYVIGFLGCLYARAIAVPVPPHGTSRKIDRLMMIARDSGAKFVLTTRPILSRVEKQFDTVCGLRSLTWLTTDEINTETSTDWQPPRMNGNAVAFLQYTSGSTTTPRGVMVTHANLLHNERLIREAFNQSEQSVILSWLPLYHDMGLIGGVLQPLYLGARCILMSPFAFMQSPVRWLRAISNYKVTTSGGPNFAYDLCARKVSRQDCAGLDLSSWSVAFNGAEPIRAETIDRFAETFMPFGFKRESFFPCYGLAEATLLVSGQSTARQPLVKSFKADALKRNLIVAADPGEQDSRSLVASGQIPSCHKVIIVDLESLTQCVDDHVGEIWVSGPSVTGGYYNRSEETRETFQAHTADTGEGPFLRTGDLGVIRDNALFVTGRVKDLMVIRGQNFYPHDVESTVERSSLTLRRGCGAAFSVEADGRERLVVVQEVETRCPQNPHEVIGLIRQSVTEEHQLQAHAVVLIKAGSLPKTSSGKVRRQACRSQFLEGSLNTVAEWREPAPWEIDDSTPEWDASLDRLEAAEKWLASFLSAKEGLEISAIDLDQPAIRYGLDSLTATDLIHRLDASLGIRLPLTALFDGKSISDLAELVAVQLGGPPNPDPPNPDRLTPQAEQDVAEFRLSHGQQALCFLHDLDPGNPAYNIAPLARVRHPLDAAAIRRAFQKLIDRHSALRTSFTATPLGPVQRVRQGRDAQFLEVDAATWTEDRLKEQVAGEASRHFNLEEDSLLRIILYHRVEESWLLVVAHHIVVDMWSFGLMVKELGLLYSAEASGTGIELAPPSSSFSEYVQWQEEMLAGAEGERLWEYWKQKLSGELPVLEMPTDRPRPAIQTYAGDSHSFKLPGEAVDGLSRLSRANGTTLFISFATAFEVFLQRYTGQSEILLGTLTSGRSRARFSDVVGYFVNPLALRCGFSDEPTFISLLSGMRRTALEAFEHQDYPFPLLAHQLPQARDAGRPPLIQAMFIYQAARQFDQSALARFAVGEAGARLKIGEMEIESLPLNLKASQFDLTLKLAATEDAITGSLEYNTSLFDASTVARMADHFQSLIDGAFRRPELPVSRLPIMRESERRQLLIEWNRTHAAFPADRCVHTLIEGSLRLTPDSVAVSFGEEQVTCDELNRRANQVAHCLRRLGVGPEARVGICADRSVEMIVGLLGILKSGGAYVPLDPGFPRERLSSMIAGSKLSAIITCDRVIGTLASSECPILILDSDRCPTRQEGEENPSNVARPDNLAYVIHTSGSTGKPKGVMVSHRNVVNFFHVMDRHLGGSAPGVWLAVTSISFDISVLELLWTLSRGFRLVIQGDQDYSPHRAAPGFDSQGHGARGGKIDFSLFYFASDEREVADDRYKLLFEGARFADEHDFSAVWTPERHFHQFGGLYPNPSVTAAAVAAITRKVGIRAGSVVLPLHNPIRVAEEWSVVDNISNGRVGISVASGWHADDFILAPGNYADRKELMLRHVETIRRLWRGESIPFRGGAGNDVEVRIFPRPVQRELPIWVTAAGNSETFRVAGQIGASLLTHLLGQTLEELADKVAVYRQSWREHGHGPGNGHVTLMVHTFVGDDLEEVRARVRGPFCSYLKSSYGLAKNFARSVGLEIESDNFTREDLESLIAHAFDRYFQNSGLMGTPNTCMETVERVRSIGVDELACLIDFGVETESVLRNLCHLDKLRRQAQTRHGRARAGHSIPVQINRHGVTHLQCTPSMARLLAHEPESFGALQNLEKLLVGGEALPLSLAQQLRGFVTGAVHNMYGPTETTVWSSTEVLGDAPRNVTIGRPIGNTEAYILDGNLEPVPIKLHGVLHLGGEGVARGYLDSPDLTAERFLPDPFSGRAGARLYVTGDVTRYLADGKIEFLGRADHQVKLRGHRIELGEIESALERHPAVLQAAAVLQENSRDDHRLVAYVVSRNDGPPNVAELRELLRRQLPDYMVPSSWVNLDAMPLTPNGKIYRKGLPLAEQGSVAEERVLTPPRDPLERVLAEALADALGLDRVGIDDDFFKMGGHSILASRLVSQLRETFQVELPLRAFFEAPTVAGLANAMAPGQEERARVRKIAELLTRVAGYSNDEVDGMLAEIES